MAANGDAVRQKNLHVQLIADLIGSRRLKHDAGLADVDAAPSGRHAHPLGSQSCGLAHTDIPAGADALPVTVIRSRIRCIFHGSRPRVFSPVFPILVFYRPAFTRIVTSFRVSTSLLSLSP